MMEKLTYKGSPGPWVYDGETSSRVMGHGDYARELVIKSGTSPIAKVSELYGSQCYQQKYNASLISAAPELLVALVKTYGILQDLHTSGAIDFKNEDIETMQEALAVLNKAVAAE